MQICNQTVIKIQFSGNKNKKFRKQSNKLMDWINRLNGNRKIPPSILPIWLGIQMEEYKTWNGKGESTQEADGSEDFLCFTGRDQHFLVPLKTFFSLSQSFRLNVRTGLLLQPKRGNYFFKDENTFLGGRWRVIKLIINLAI